MKNKLFPIIIISILLSISTNQSYGNSAEPPSILIIVPNAPDNMEISIGDGDTFTKARKIDKLIETYYIFYSREIERAVDYPLKIYSDEGTYEINFDKPINSYNNIYTLKTNTQTLIPGKLLSRSILLVSIRIILTLIIEGIIFWLFGFRMKMSWIYFLLINLITQGALNIWINGFPPSNSYSLFFALLFAEFFIFIFETLSFTTLVKERSKSQRVLYVLVANNMSLIAGGYIISILPI